MKKLKVLLFVILEFVVADASAYMCKIRYSTCNSGALWLCTDGTLQSRNCNGHGAVDQCIANLPFCSGFTSGFDATKHSLEIKDGCYTYSCTSSRQDANGQTVCMSTIVADKDKFDECWGCKNKADLRECLTSIEVPLECQVAM